MARCLPTHPPGELLEGLEGHHGSHALAGRGEGGVQQHVAHAGYVHHAIVIQVGGEGHSVMDANTQRDTQTHKSKV